MSKLRSKVRQILPGKIVTLLRRVDRKFQDFKYQLFFLRNYGRLDFFDVIDIEVNTYCNRRCPYCPNSAYEKGLKKNEKFMSEKTYEKLIDELAKLKFRGRITPCFYNEPLTDNRLLDLIGYARKKLPYAKIIITTNGDYLDIKSYRNLIKAGVDSFYISQHNCSKPSEKLKQVFDFVKKNRNLRRTIHYEVIDPKSRPLFNRGGLVRPQVVSETPICIDYGNPLIVDYQGNILLCCNDYFGSVNFGNINEKSLLEIWDSEKFKSLRKRLRRGIYDLPICRKCVGK